MGGQHKRLFRNVHRFDRALKNGGDEEWGAARCIGHQDSRARRMDDETPRLSIILPAFNEALRIVDLATRLQFVVDEGALCARTTEVIVVDDGSTDETASRAEELLADTFHRLLVLRQPDNRGKGAAVRLGATAASAPLALFMDADMSVDPTEIPGLIDAIGTGTSPSGRGRSMDRLSRPTGYSAR